LIEQTIADVEIGSNAIRQVVDYRVDRHAAMLIAELAQSHKLTNVFSIRNETVVLQLVQKYCQINHLHFQHQYRLANFVFDCAIGHFLLIEFDEQHHKISRRQQQIDTEKEYVARENGWFVLRVTLEMDIVDIIVAIERKRGSL
jgi:very-short-patch-repair endonuclease